MTPDPKPYLVYLHTHTLIPFLDHRIGSVMVDGVFACSKHSAELLAEDRNPVHPWESLIVIEQPYPAGRAQVRRWRRRRNRQINELLELMGVEA